MTTSSMEHQLGPVLSALKADSASLLASIQTALPSDTDVLNTAQGPSLLTLKNAALLNYLHHLVLLCSLRLRGGFLTKTQRSTSQNGAQLVRNLIEMRLVLEKVRPVEGRMRGLLERLMRAADDEDQRIRQGTLDVVNGQQDAAATDDVDPLAFRPNLSALSSSVTATGDGSQKTSSKKRSSDEVRDEGVYRPPRLAPVVYNAEAAGTKKGKERLAPRNAALLSDLSASMSANPYEVSSGGVGVGAREGSGSSARAKALARMQQYEEENFTRVVMNKRDAKRRRRDEADVALGGAGLSNARGRVGAGLEEEFGDLLRNSSSSDVRNVRRSAALQRARSSGGGSGGDGDDFGLGSSSGGGENRMTTFQKRKRNDSKRRR